MATPSLPTGESYLVVGGNLPLGGEHIVDQLLRRGEKRVSIFDGEPLTAENAARFGDAVRVYVGDITSLESVSDAVKSVSACLSASRMTSPSQIVRGDLHNPHWDGQLCGDEGGDPAGPTRAVHVAC
jgi:hypothetical protein